MSTTTTGTAVLTEVRGHVLLITLNRPHAHNAIDAELGRGLEEALAWLEREPELRVGVLTGAGGKAFCAGADLKALARGERLNPDGDRNRGVGVLFRRPVGKPLVAAVAGIALGGGSEIAFACDLVVAGESAVFGFPEVTRGIVAAGSGALRLAREIPTKLAMELLLTGERVDARTAAGFGLVNRVVPDGEVLAAAMALAERVAANAPVAVRATRRLVRDGNAYGQLHDPELWAWHDGVVREVMRTDDAKEGPRAFAEKRAPRWTGR